MASPAAKLISADQTLLYRARVTHLDAKLPYRSIAKAAWGGLQDSVPRGGVVALHARVDGTKPDSWEHPALVQIWFRGGADYIVPRDDVGIFTLGCLPRDVARVAELERLADEIHAATDGKMMLVREVADRIGHRSAGDPFHPRASSTTGRVHIRWDASNIWVIPAERPDIDIEDARRELARRFLHWFAPATRRDLARWTGVKIGETAETWAALERDVVEVEVAGERRFVLNSDVEALEAADAIEGVRLLPQDDPFTRLDPGWLVPDARLRGRALPRAGQWPGYIPGALLVDGRIAGAWQRQQRKVTVHPFEQLSVAVREAVEREAVGLPIAGSAAPLVVWD
jgi:hypothetical protein